MVVLLLFPVLLVNKDAFSVCPYEYKPKLSQKAMQENYPFATVIQCMFPGELSHQMKKLYLLHVDLHLKKKTFLIPLSFCFAAIPELNAVKSFLVT